ncbi:molybdenum cofactor guanylyltransferase MobA [Macromonas nakdongensis]|uniref:molybdenum cofactor guanylyltransferase MobA n=1 Tax=Macromonas nakdongensis TaxID=1843082 RepID=UPI000C348698|nr:molybdenum cofactor guanylyltransferase MobA [Macromonas nakdongensis]
MKVGPHSVTGVVLSGGRGSRMGGVDKGLQPFHGTPLALNALQRLQRQQGTRLAGTLVNANRYLADYATFGAPVWPDELPDYAGPLAGFLAGLAHCPTPYLLTVPCDVPLYPLDLLERLALALEHSEADIALASAREGSDTWRTQPVFCLMKTDLRDSLLAYTQAGGRKVEGWTRQHRTVTVPFDQAGDDPQAFCNANTLPELRALEG